VKSFMKIAVLTAVCALPVTAHAQNQTDIFHQKQLSAQAFFSVSTNNCAYSYAEVDIAQLGFKETGNVTKDKFSTSEVLVYLNYIDICDLTKDWYLVGSTNTGNVKINGSGQIVFASGSATSMRLDGQNGNGANITDFATVSIDAKGSIVFSQDENIITVSRFGSGKNFTTKFNTSRDSGPATNLNVSLSTDNLGPISGPWSGSVYNSKDWRLQVIHPTN
jgi:VCBS repeat-containing protein